MLWKKESNVNDSMYVDMYALNGGRANFDKFDSFVRSGKPSSKLKKNGVVSLEKRKEGNAYFSQGNWIRAMELYGESLCYAERGSKNANLAYEARSNCFLMLKRYKECLVDIELAKAAGYPAKLMPKLDQRKEECLKAIQDGAESMILEPKLSFAPDQNVPCMANVLKIKRDAEGKLELLASKDIDVGQTIVTEKMLMTFLYTHYGWKCNICLKQHTNLIPCDKCTVAMFCTEKCHGHRLHEYECGLRYSDNTMMNGTIMRVLRGCLQIIDMFSDADELMTFVEQTISTDPNQIPLNLTDEKSRYATFLQLPKKPRSNEHHEFLLCLGIAFSTQKLLMRIPKINFMFKHVKYRRFLIHFITHLYQVIENNSIISGSDYDDTDENYVPFNSRTGIIIASPVSSCAPNVMILESSDDTVCLFTIRPVMKGQPILHSVLPHLLILSKRERRQMLWDDRKMLCKCERCESVTVSKALQKRIRSDPDYQYITKSNRSTRGDGDGDGAKQATQTMIDICERFLRKYGQSSWSNEFGRVVLTYMTIMNRR